MSAGPVRVEKSNRQKTREILEKHPLPAHWQPPHASLPLGRLRRALFKALCICAYGQTSLESIWASIKLEEEGDDSLWFEGQRAGSDQQSTLLVLAGLLLTTSAVFISTIPPVPSILDYTRTGPYTAISISFGLLIGGIIVSSICILASKKLTAQHTAEVLYANTLHVHSTLLVISYPTISIITAALLLALGIFVAGLDGGNLGYNLSGGFLFLLPLSIGVLFLVSSMPISAGREAVSEAPKTGSAGDPLTGNV